MILQERYKIPSESDEISGGIFCPSKNNCSEDCRGAEGKYENGNYYSMNLEGLKSDSGNSITGQSTFDFYIPGY